jgi:uncharacterized protein (TIGR02246 family)
MAVSFPVTRWGNQAGVVYSSIPPRTIHAVIPQNRPRRTSHQQNQHLNANNIMTLTPTDSLEIMQLVTRADNCATARDASGYAELFTDDGTMTGDMGRAQGRAALRHAVAGVWEAEPARTLHLTLNVTIDESGPDPTVTSVMLMVTRDAKPDVLGSALVRQVVRQTAKGWRIASREIEAA